MKNLLITGVVVAGILIITARSKAGVLPETRKGVITKRLDEELSKQAVSRRVGEFSEEFAKRYLKGKESEVEKQLSATLGIDASNVFNIDFGTRGGGEYGGSRFDIDFNTPDVEALSSVGVHASIAAASLFEQTVDVFETIAGAFTPTPLRKTVRKPFLAVKQKIRTIRQRFTTIAKRMRSEKGFKDAWGAHGGVGVDPNTFDPADPIGYDIDAGPEGSAGGQGRSDSPGGSAGGSIGGGIGGDIR